MRGYAIAEGAGTPVLTNLPWVLFVGKPGGLSRALLIHAGWVINLAVAEWAFRTRPTKPTRTAMVPTDRGRDEAPRKDSERAARVTR